ncbi:MAG: hypothetical protein N3E49_04645 [Bacteroidia bacterium]|nr:hypothetical protein [Bacteroidia bacterium]
MRLIGEWSLPGHSGPVYALTCDYVHRTLFSAGSDGYIAQWRCSSGKHAYAVARTPNAIYSLHFIPSNQNLYVGESSGTVYVLDLEHKKLKRCMRAHENGVFGLGSHPSDPEGWSSGRDGYFLFWDIEQSEPFAAIRVSSEGLRGFALSAQTNSFFCAGRDGYLYEIARSERGVRRKVQADPHFVLTVQTCPTNDWVASGGKSGALKLWTLDLELVWEQPAHTLTLNTIAWHPSGKYIATGGRDRLIHIWKADSGEKLLTLPGHLRSVNALIWISPDTLASGGDDGLVKIWHLEGLPEK